MGSRSKNQMAMLSQLGKWVGGGTPSTDNESYWNGNIPWVSPKDMGNAYITSTQDYITDAALSDSSTTLVPKDSILVVTRSGILRSKVPVALTSIPMAINQDIKALIPDGTAYTPYIAQALWGNQKKLLMQCVKSGTTVESIDLQQLKDFKIYLSPLPEQRKIAAILRTWDEAIEKLEKVKQHRKKLFEQRRRSLTNIASGHHVKLMPLSEISEEISRRNDGYDAPVMMISSTQGFIRQDENYDREMAGESLKKYIHLKKGEFAYNKGNSKTYPYGCVFRLNVDEALIPFVYICFSLSRELNASYFSHYFEAGSLNRQLVRLISSSVRGNGLLNIDSEDFFSCLIPVPDRKYQDKSAEYLDAAAKELSVLDSEIAALKNQKRGLMQKLLTGAWRVQVDELPNKKEKQHVG